MYLFISISTNPSIDLSIHLYIYPSMYMPIHLSNHLSIHPSVHLSIYLYVYPSIYPFIYISIHLSIYPLVRLSLNLYLYVYLSICPFIDLSVCLPVRLSIRRTINTSVWYYFSFLLRGSVCRCSCEHFNFSLSLSVSLSLPLSPSSLFLSPLFSLPLPLSLSEYLERVFSLCRFVPLRLFLPLRFLRLFLLSLLSLSLTACSFSLYPTVFVCNTWHTLPLLGSIYSLFPPRLFRLILFAVSLAQPPRGWERKKPFFFSPLIKPKPSALNELSRHMPLSSIHHQFTNTSVSLSGNLRKMYRDWLSASEC